MNAHSLSVVVGSAACNAKCPFCVSKMTPACGVVNKLPDFNWRNLDKAMKLAVSCGANTALVTGKGEPTLFPMQVSDVLWALRPNFPLIELQTNGLTLHDPDMDEYLQEWYEAGLTMVNLSVVSEDPVLNQRIYTGDKPYPDLTKLIEKLHTFGFSVRLSVTMLDGYMSTWERIKNFIDYAKSTKVEQITMRPVSAPEESEDPATAEWVDRFSLNPHVIKYLGDLFKLYGKKVLTLPYGGCIYDVGGQNVCWTDCLTLPKDADIRQLIYFPDGHLRYDWQYKGAVIF